MPSVEVVNNASFMVIFPLTFIANTFVPAREPARAAADVRRVEPGLGGDPGGARAVRQHPAAETISELHRPGHVASPSDAWPLQNPVLYTLIWVVVILAIFVPLSVRQYRRANTKN